MIGNRRIAAWAFVVTGAVGPVVLTDVLKGSTTTLAGTFVIGGALMLTGILWDDSLNRRLLDERDRQIRYRSGYTAAVTMVVMLYTLLFVTWGTDIAVTADLLENTIVLLLVLDGIAYLGSSLWLKRSM